eukprot:CAMPEP_0181101064 /NCGR_PEP_ID=MMETSP1071-20121207/13544_1 /TAXON_ID=35127 /ORGANISM="Thalassiosira sp., Strain NH16" /LENGTH=70 /DNA_ID=CAMNT_0023183869 /DNA_START=1245 /DNA_END=1457 /DNA_ORIENTATION=+
MRQLGGYARLVDWYGMAPEYRGDGAADFLDRGEEDDPSHRHDGELGEELARGGGLAGGEVGDVHCLLLSV